MIEHFLQSEEWRKYEELEGNKALRVEGEGFRAMAVVKSTPLGKYLYCPYGPVLTEVEGTPVEETLRVALDSLAEVAKAEGAFFLRVEPTVKIDDEQMKKLGLVKSQELNPAHTWVIDLTGTQEDVLRGMEKRKARAWKKREENGIIIRKTQDASEVGVLMKFLAGLGERDHFHTQSEEHLRNQLKSGFAWLYIAEFEGKPVAAALFFDGGEGEQKARYAVHAADDNEHKDLRAGAILSIEAMLDAQKAGAKVFDFWGVTPSEDRNHPWYGFTQYKKTFGGREVDYAGTWDLPLAKAKYRAYLALRKVNRARRKKV